MAELRPSPQGRSGAGLCSCCLPDLICKWGSIWYWSCWHLKGAFVSFGLGMSQMVTSKKQEGAPAVTRVKQETSVTPVLRWPRKLRWRLTGLALLVIKSQLPQQLLMALGFGRRKCPSPAEGLCSRLCPAGASLPVAVTKSRHRGGSAQHPPRHLHQLLGEPKRQEHLNKQQTHPSSGLWCPPGGSVVSWGAQGDPGESDFIVVGVVVQEFLCSRQQLGGISALRLGPSAEPRCTSAQR